MQRSLNPDVGFEPSPVFVAAASAATAAESKPEVSDLIEFDPPPIVLHAAKSWPRPFAGASQATANALEHALKLFSSDAVTHWELDSHFETTSASPGSCQLTLHMTVNKMGDTDTKKNRREESAEPKPVPLARKAARKSKAGRPIVRKKESDDDEPFFEEHLKPIKKPAAIPIPVPVPIPAAVARPCALPYKVVPIEFLCITSGCKDVATRQLGMCERHRQGVFADPKFVKPPDRALLYQLFEEVMKRDTRKELVLIDNSAADAVVWRGLSPYSSSGTFGVELGADIFANLLLDKSKELIVSRFSKKELSVSKPGTTVSIVVVALDSVGETQSIPFAHMLWRISKENIAMRKTYLGKFGLDRPVPVGQHFLAALPPPLLANGAPFDFVRVVCHPTLLEGLKAAFADFSEIECTTVDRYPLFYALAMRFYAVGSILPGLLMSSSVCNPGNVLIVQHNSLVEVNALALVSHTENEHHTGTLHVHFVLSAPEDATAHVRLLQKLIRQVPFFSATTRIKYSVHRLQPEIEPLFFHTGWSTKPGSTLEAEQHYGCSLGLQNTTQRWQVLPFTELFENPRSDGMSYAASALLGHDAVLNRVFSRDNFYDYMAYKYVTAMRFLDFVYPMGSLPKMVRALWGSESLAEWTLARPVFSHDQIERHFQLVAKNTNSIFFDSPDAVFALDAKEWTKRLSVALSETHRNFARLRTSHHTVTENKNRKVRQFEGWLRLALGLDTGEDMQGLLKETTIEMLCPLAPPSVTAP